MIDCPGLCTLLIRRCSVCAVAIPYLALFPKYLSSDDKTWYNTNVQTLHQVVINLSVITAGIPSVSRFFSDLQTGRLAFSNAEIEMTTGHSKTRSPLNSKINHSQTSARFGRGQRSTRDKNNLSLTQSNGDVLDNSQDLHLRPDRTTRYVTRVVGGSGGGVGSERAAGERKANLGVGTKSDDDISDDKSTSSLTKHGVYQQRDFEMHVEYDHPDGESRQWK